MSDPRLPFMMLSALVGMALWASLSVGSELLSDPTRPPASLDASAPISAELADAALDLRAIFFAEGRRVAIINDHRVQEEDVIGAARVIEIGPSHVRLRRHGKDLHLRLIRRDIKRKPGSNRDEEWEARRIPAPRESGRPVPPALEGKEE